MLLSSVLAITERRDMGLYEVPQSMSLLGFGMGTILASVPYVWYYVVKSSFKHDREECESKGADVFLKHMLIAMIKKCFPTKLKHLE